MSDAIETERPFKVVGPEFNEAYADYEFGIPGYCWRIPHGAALKMTRSGFFGQFRAAIEDIARMIPLSENARNNLRHELAATLDQKEASGVAVLDL